jgi:DNA-binding response OmpR family regulator
MATASSSGVTRRARLVLLVEDDSTTRELYGAALKEAGFCVEEAPTIASAIAALERMQPDVIVLDRALPDGDGFESLRSLRVTFARACVPVVAFTVSTEPAAREVAMSAGCTAFVRKPCAPAVLVRNVWDVLGTPSAQREPIVDS